MTLLAKRYATALYLAARDRNEVDQVERELEGLHVAVADATVKAMLTSPDIPSSERLKIVDKLVAGSSDLVRNFVHVLLERRRQEVLFSVRPEYRAIRMAERGEVDGVAESPKPLSDQELEGLKAIAAKFSGKKVDLSVAIVPDLLGGVRLRVGNPLFDGSLKSSLEQLEQALMQASV